MSFSKKESWRRKKKGFLFECRVARMILNIFHTYLGKADVKATPMGNNKEDILLSDKATEYLPVSLEAKDHNRYKGLYDIYYQATKHKPEYEAVAVITDSTRTKLVLAIVDFNHYLKLQRQIASLKEKNNKFNSTLKEESYFVPIAVKPKTIVANVTVQ